MTALGGQVAAVQALLSDRSNWLQVDIARTADNVSVEPGDPRACRFSLLGAITRVLGCYRPTELDVAEAELTKLVASAAKALTRMSQPFTVPQADVLYANDALTYERVQEILAVAHERAAGAVA